MDWRELIRYRLQIGAALAALLVIGWYTRSYRPRSEQQTALSERESALVAERSSILQQLAQEEAQLKKPKVLPSRAAPALANAMTPVDRLNYFLDNITKPANALELSYFTVTPLPPTSGEGFEEIPFSISVAGSYAALADYLYQLEYGQDFIVRDLSIGQRESAVQADFRLSALLLKDPRAQPGTRPATDPGRPTSLELARDPFIRPPAKIALGPDGKSYFLNVPPGLHLSGIMRAGGKAVAIINHEPRGIGESIDNKTITKISDRGVELSDKVRAYFLEMEQPPHSTKEAPKP